MGEQRHNNDNEELPSDPDPRWTGPGHRMFYTQEETSSNRSKGGNLAECYIFVPGRGRLLTMDLLIESATMGLILIINPVIGQKLYNIFQKQAS